MKTEQLLDQILPILHSVKDDEGKLQKILDFLLSEIYEEPDDIIVIPEKYKGIVYTIAENIDCGLVCYLNPETLEIEEVSSELAEDPEEFEGVTGESWDDSFKHTSWEKCITVEPPVSSDSFKIMEQFINEVEDKKLQNQLVKALSNRRPFANFKAIIENSEYRQQWFDFKQNKLEEMVWDELSFQLNNDDDEPYIEDINGFYNDDGTKIDPASVPVPGLCVICRKHQIDDWEENLLCLMNRNDQKNELNFKCGSFEKL